MGIMLKPVQPKALPSAERAVGHGGQQVGQRSQSQAGLGQPYLGAVLLPLQLGGGRMALPLAQPQGLAQLVVAYLNFRQRLVSRPHC